MQRSSTITWLHISDLHFRTSSTDDTTYDANIVLQALLSDISKRVHQDGLSPDFVAVTGDVAFAGQPGEYALARTFFEDLLKAVNLPRDRLFVVPGNHDVDRKLVTNGAKATGAALTDRDQANQLLVTPGDRKLVLERFQGYAEFFNDYFADHLQFDDERFFYVSTLDIKSHKIAFEQRDTFDISKRARRCVHFYVAAFPRPLMPCCRYATPGTQAPRNR